MHTRDRHRSSSCNRFAPFAWFAELKVHAVTEPILRGAAALRRQQRMKLGDAIIAGTALAIGAELVTRNVDDFRHIAGLHVINPFEEPSSPE
jgi:predicted nucleic acid-binding protein